MDSEVPFVYGRQDVQMMLQPGTAPVHTGDAKPAEQGLVEQGQAWLKEFKHRKLTPAEAALVAAAALAAAASAPAWAF